MSNTVQLTQNGQPVFPLTDASVVSGISDVAKSGDYDDLENKPTIPDVTGKADKVSNATNGNFAALDANGNLTDSGHKHSDYLTSHQDISGKADKVSNATNGHLAGLDSNGNLTDSGKSASDFQPTIDATHKLSYNLLSDTPTIPAAQVQTYWNASSGMGVLLNKPNLATVATSGSYNDLSNKPTIPTVTALTTSEIDTIWGNAS